MRRWFGRLGLAVGGLLVGLAGVEAASRIAGAQAGAELFYAAPDAAPAGLYVTDRALLMVPQPGFTGRARALDRAIEVRIDARGLRGAGDATGGWLMVGDSFTLGLQVEEAATAAARLSAHLGVPVHNGGVDGYSTFQAAGRYAALADAVQPDGVLLVLFLGNDLHDNVAWERQQGRMAGTIDGRPIPRPAIAPSVRLLSRVSHAYARYRVWRRSREVTGMGEAHRRRWRDQLRIFTGDGARRLDQLLPQTAAALDGLVAETAQRGDRLVVALAPPAIAVHAERRGPTLATVDLDPADATPDAPARAVARLLAERGVATCDLTGPLRAAAAGGADVYYAWDGHWTPDGHAAAARALAACIGAP